MTDLTVYSASFGGMDSNYPQPDIDADRIMFSDGESAWGNVVNPHIAKSPRDAAKTVKMNPWIWFDGATAYLDATIGTTPLFQDEVRKFLASNKVIGLVRAPYANCLYREAEILLSIADTNKLKCDHDAIAKHVGEYAAEGFPEHSGMWLGGIVFAKPEGHYILREWAHEYASHGHLRDQISLAYVMSRHRDKLYDIPYDSITQRTHTYSAKMECKYEKLGNDYHWKWIENGMFEHLKRTVFVLSHLPESERPVIDFGCGDGVGSSILTKAGRNVIGIEILDEPRAVAEVKVPDASFAKNIEIPPCEYDLVLVDVVEHVEDEYVPDLSKLINGATCVVMSVPHYGMDAYAVRDVSVEWIAENLASGFRLVNANEYGRIYGKVA